MSTNNRERLRATFDANPELYDQARPFYPPALFDDLRGLAALGNQAAIIEIGCGTGQATRALIHNIGDGLTVKGAYIRIPSNCDFVLVDQPAELVDPMQVKVRY